MKAKFKTATDFRKSLEMRLKDLAIETNQDLQRLWRKMAFERLLARIVFLTKLQVTFVQFNCYTK